MTTSRRKRSPHQHHDDEYVVHDNGHVVFDEGEESVPMVSSRSASPLEFLMHGGGGGGDKNAPPNPKTMTPFNKGLYATAIVALLFLVAVLFYAIWKSLPSPSPPPPHGHLLVSGVPRYDDAFTLALSEVANNTIAGGKFIAGAGWTQLWTRDTSYAVELSAALRDPEASAISLRSSTHPIRRRDGQIDGETWLQDECGHFGGWPNLTDASVGAQGAWAYFVATGDTDFLSWAYDVTNRTLAWAELEAFDDGDDGSGLFRGCSSFMESNSGYPLEYSMNGSAVGQTKALSTNVLYYNAYTVASKMGQVLRKPKSEIDAFLTKARQLKTAIRSRLWQEEKGYYAYFEDARGRLVPQMEGLGESLLLLADDLETDPTRINRIFQSTYRSSVGIPCLWPRFDLPVENPYDIATWYHNGRIWPFVQGYWAMAAAKHGKVDVFGEEFENLVRLSRMNDTFAEFYELDGTFPEARRRQLWSSSGFIGMVYHGLFGVQLEPGGITFRPVKPAAPFANTVSLWNLRYRKATLNIHVSGSGSKVVSFRLNGTSFKNPFVSSKVVGSQLIEIALK